MSAYQSVFAELYDMFYEQKPYQAEVEFLHEKLATYGVKNILELACGTGNHALLLATLGYQITAIDLSADMILQARAKQQEMERSGRLPVSMLSFVQADMSDLPPQTGMHFDAVLCLFDSLGYLLTNAAIRKALRGIYEKLKPGGVFIVEYWHGATMARHYEESRIRRWQTPDSEVVRLSETKLDYCTQIADIRFTVYQIFHDGRAHVHTELHRNRFFLVQEMCAFLEEAGFEVHESLGGYSHDTAIDANTWHVLTIAQKP
jgi:SAM-dependent methyltransferase